jgi:hypothetical protein
MMAICYDNDASHLPANEGAVPIERVYCLRLSEFDPAQWERLQRLYESLPGWAGTGQHGCPCWFGTTEHPPFLMASVEPSGLQVTGSLPSADWSQWHNAFLDGLPGLPLFEV